MWTVTVLFVAFAAIAAAVVPPGTLIQPHWPAPYLTVTAKGTFTAPGNRDASVTAVAWVTLPLGTSQPDGTLFEAGCAGSGTFVGIENNAFVVAAGQGSPSTVTDEHTVVLRMPLSDHRLASYFDGGFHEVAVLYRPDGGKVELVVDGVFVAKEATTTGLHLNVAQSLWSGSNTAGFGVADCVTEAVSVTADWPGAWHQDSILRFYLASASMTPIPVALTTPGTVVEATWPAPYLLWSQWTATFDSPDNRKSNVAAVIDATMPTPQEFADGTLLKSGCKGAGMFIGINGANFIAASGKGTGATSTSDYTAVISIPLTDPRIASKMDGGVHEVAVKMWPTEGKLDLYFDGVFVARETTTSGQLHDTEKTWSGVDDAGLGTGNGCVTDAANGVTGTFPVGTLGQVRYYLLSGSAPAIPTPTPPTPSPPPTPAPVTFITPGTVVEANWPAPYLAWSAWAATFTSPDNRKSNVAAVIDATMPTPQEFADGTLLKSGCKGAGMFIGINGANFIAASGKGTGATSTSDYTAVISIPLTDPRIASKMDGGVHEVAVKMWPTEGKLDLYFDGVFVARETTTSGQLHDTEKTWSGVDDAGLGTGNGCVTDAADGVVSAFPVGQAGLVRYYLLSGSAPETPPPATPNPQPPAATCDGSCLNYRCVGALRTTADGIVTVLLKGSTTGTVWGSVSYTSDSHVAAAAVHAGVLADGETKLVRVQCVGSLPSFTGTTQNSVTTLAWPSAWQSFIFVDDASHSDAPPPSQPEICYHWFCATSKCVARGQQFEVVVTGTAASEHAIYGVVTYTDDSDIRLAAVHAGVLEPGETATLTVMCHGPRDSYPSATQNGITSLPWPSFWGHSWTLAKKE